MPIGRIDSYAWWRLYLLIVAFTANTLFLPLTCLGFFLIAGFFNNTGPLWVGLLVACLPASNLIIFIVLFCPRPNATRKARILGILLNAGVLAWIGLAWAIRAYAHDMSLAVEWFQISGVRYVVPLTLLSLLAALSGAGLRRVGDNTCSRCGYDLRGNLDAGCPECGWNRESEVTA